MNSALAALVNGAILSVPVTATVWLGLRLAPRRMLNAATRYVVWWAALAVAITLPAVYLPIYEYHRLGWEPSLAVAPQERLAGPKAPPRTGSDARRTTATSHDSVFSIEAPSRDATPSSRRPLFPVEVAAGHWPDWIVTA